MDAGVAAVLGASIGGMIGLLSIFLQASMQEKSKAKEKLEQTYIELVEVVTKCLVNSQGDKILMSKEEIELIAIGLAKLHIYGSSDNNSKIKEIRSLIINELDLDQLGRVHSLLLQSAKKDLIKVPVKITEPPEY